ncbi:ATP-binding protein [soil metagenome]
MAESPRSRAEGVPPGADYIELDARKESSAAARAFVATVIGRTGAHVPDEVLLLTSEATTNAGLHADSECVTVAVERIGDTIRVSVHDDDPVPPTVMPADPSRPGGLGVRLIDHIAADWGVEEVIDDGKVVWFEVPL